MTGGLSRPQPLGIISEQDIIKRCSMHLKDYYELVLTEPVRLKKTLLLG